MRLAAGELGYLREHHSAAMITVSARGVAKAARVVVGLVDDRLWSSGTRSRARTRRLRRDPRCTLFVFDASYTWLALETSVTIIEGPQVPELSIRLFRLTQGRPSGPLAWGGRELDEEAFARAMVDEGRLIYDFEVERSYGMPGARAGGERSAR